MQCFCVGGTLEDLDCVPGYIGGATNLRAQAILGTGERCLPLMDGGTLDIIDMLLWASTNTQAGPNWQTALLPSNIATLQTDRIVPAGSWYDITIFDDDTNRVISGPFRVRLDADAGYVLVNGCVPLSTLLTVGVTL